MYIRISGTKLATLVTLVPILLLGCILFVPGIHVLDNTWMIVESGAGNWVPRSASLISFQCTQASEGGTTSYCFFGRDWSSYYAACDPAAKQCSDGFTAYGKSAAKRCAGFEPHDVKTWCGSGRASRPAFKGYELYSWKRSDGDWLYSLLPGTNRLKTKEEIAAAGTDFDALKKHLSALAVNEQVLWVPAISEKAALPDAGTVADLQAFCETMHIQLEVPR
jgi:hypothetical protein